MKAPRVLAATLALLGSTLLVAGCETTYAYVPVTSAVTTTAGQVVADYPLPPEAPRGNLRIASYGISEVDDPNTPSEHLNALHLRMIVTDNDDKEWSIDTRQQRVDLDGRGTGAPTFAAADAGETTPPILTVPVKGKRVVDLFFALPSDMQSAEKVPKFDAVWKVNVGPQAYQGRTPFARLEVEPEPTYYDYGYNYYWGGPYWYDPYYPSYYSFHGGVVVPPHYYHHPVHIYGPHGGHYGPGYAPGYGHGRGHGGHGGHPGHPGGGHPGGGGRGGGGGHR